MYESRLIKRFLLSAVAGGCALMGAVAHAQTLTGDPLPRCAPSENAMHLLRYSEPVAPASSTVSISKLAVGPATAPAPVDAVLLSDLNPSSVAAGMRPQDGYIYAVRAPQRTPMMLRKTLLTNGITVTTTEACKS